MKRSSCFLLALLCVAAFASSLPAAEQISARLVKDINVTSHPQGSEPQWFSNHGSSVTFRAHSGQGRQRRYGLWRTDGTAEGTARIPWVCDYPTCQRVWNRGTRALYQTGQGDLWSVSGVDEAPQRLLAASRAVAWFPSDDVPPAPILGGRVFFIAKAPSTGRELWVTDFTAGGTRLVKDLWPGAGDSFPSAMTWWQDRLYFFASRSQGGLALWKTGGTEATTQLVFDFNPGASDDLGYEPQILGGAAGGLVVNAWSPSRGLELWVSRGTAATTRPLPELVAGSASLGGVGLGGTIAGRIVFTSGSKVYSTDGRHAAVRLPGRPSDAHRILGAVGGRLVYQNAPFHRRVWSTDGTAAGTIFLAELGAQGTSVTLAGRLIVSAHDVENRLSLWSLGAEDAVEIGPVCSTNCNLSRVTSQVKLGNETMFVVTVAGSSEAPSLWSTVGGGTAVQELLSAFPGWLETTLAGQAFGWMQTNSSGKEPILVSATGERSILEINPAVASGSSFAEPLTSVGNRIVFRTRLDRDYGLWSSDGTEIGTVPLRSDDPVPSDSLLSQVGTAGHRFLVLGNYDWEGHFFGRVVSIGEDPLRSTLVMPTGQEEHLRAPDAPVALGDRVLFAGLDRAAGVEPWASDGTVAGTKAIDVVPGPESSGFFPRVEFAGLAYGIAYPERRLWSSDGTALGTGPVEGAAGSIEPAMTVAQGHLYFLRYLPEAGLCPMRLWRLEEDRSEQLVSTLSLPCGELKETWMYPSLGGIVLVAELTRGRYGVWFSDGAPGSPPLNPILLGNQKPIHPLLATLGSRFYLQPAFGELWSSDGTAEGTRREAWWQDAPLTTVSDLLPIGNHLLVSASVDGDQALWWTDGTADGAQRLMSGSNPLVVDDRVFFTGVDHRGAELWVLEGFPDAR